MRLLISVLAIIASLFVSMGSFAQETRCEFYRLDAIPMNATDHSVDISLPPGKTSIDVISAMVSFHTGSTYHPNLFGGLFSVMIQKDGAGETGMPPLDEREYLLMIAYTQQSGSWDYRVPYKWTSDDRMRVQYAGVTRPPEPVYVNGQTVIPPTLPHTLIMADLSICWEEP